MALETEEEFIERCVRVVSTFPDALCDKSTVDVRGMIRSTLLNILPLAPFGSDNAPLEGIFSPHAIGVVGELINLYIDTRCSFSYGKQCGEKQTDSKVARLVDGHDEFLRHLSNWDDITISRDALNDACRCANLQITSSKMDADVKRAIVNERCELQGRARPRPIAATLDRNDKASSSNVHVVFPKVHFNIARMLEYVEVSRVLRRKCRLCSFSHPIPEYGTTALVYEDFDISVMELVPCNNAWGRVATECFWNMASEFVRPKVNEKSTGSLFQLLDQLEDLHMECFVHTELSRSTVKYDSSDSSFQLCGLDRVARADRNRDDALYKANVTQCALVIKTVLEFLIRMFFLNVKDVGSMEDEDALVTQWSASLASWSILRNSIYGALRGDMKWRTTQKLRRWLMRELDAINGPNAMAEFSFTNIRDLYARTAFGYDRK